MSELIDPTRSTFEQWVSAPPYERDISRWPQDESKHAWPGHYKDIAVQLAWEAWCESPQIWLAEALASAKGLG